METRILSPTQSNIQMCADELNNSGVVAFATETVYGLGANIFDQVAVNKIFEIKNRPADNPLIVHVCDVDGIKQVAQDISDDAYKLLQAFSPGPLTLVFKKKQCVLDIVTGGANTVACRIPNNSTAIKLIKAAKAPLCAPSANLSTRPSPTKAQYVYDDLNGKIKYILQSDQDCSFGIESTIVDMSGEQPAILRLGAISVFQIQTVLNKVLIENSKTPSPGTKYRHYAPKVPLVYIPFEQFSTKVIQAVCKPNSVVIATTQVIEQIQNIPTIDMGDIKQYTARLYAVFRESEKVYSQIIAIGVQGGAGDALNNRIIKASGCE